MRHSPLGNSYSNKCRPALHGARGAIASAHPLATAAGQEMFMAGGNAADALIAAQAVLAVACPEACGIGGDMLALVDDGKAVTAISGVGRAPMAMRQATTDGANSITVPGLAGAWESLSRGWGRLGLAACLAPAIRLAEGGLAMSDTLAAAVAGHRHRLLAGGAGEWALLGTAVGDTLRQPALAALLRAIAARGASAFYEGEAAHAIERAVARLGGALDRQDLAAHRTDMAPPVEVAWGDWTVAVQPPPTQGSLLAMALKNHQALGPIAEDRRDHVCIELTEAAFQYRSRAAEGESLLDIALDIDVEKASLRGGPRAYLHTAGVAASDAGGLSISSLVSVFDDFGSCVFVPELGITLNNRAGGFTDGANAAAPGKYPVHTLAPALLRGPGGTIALATPGADGQVQTLFQVIDRFDRRGMPLDQAVAAPRWRSEGGLLLIEADHEGLATLEALGHRVKPLPPGDVRFGAVVMAGQIGGQSFALSDWRRECWSGVA